MTSPALLARLRTRVRPLVSERAAADALASYYVFHHPSERTELFVHPEGDAPADGFLVRARTGMDLFRPLVTFRARDEDAAAALFEAGLPRGRPVYLTVPDALALWAERQLRVEGAELHRIYRFDPLAYEPQINVLVATSHGPDGLPRCEIRAGDRAGAVAGVNWQSERFAEVFVYTEQAVRGRGWGKAVVRTLVGLLLKAGRTPLYVVSENNTYSIRLAEAVGFLDTGHREFVGEAAWPRTP